MPAPLLFVFVAVSQYAGAALAVVLFEDIRPGGVAWLRVTLAALILCAWRRPWRTVRSREQLALAAAFGVVVAWMNTLFFLAIGELPLGTAVAMEFLGPVAVAALGSRRGRDVVALVVAAAGVVLLADVRWEGSPTGVAFILGAAVAWAGYIVLGHRVAAGGVGIDSLALGLIAGSVAVAPVGFGEGSVAFGSARLLAASTAVAVLSTVITYGMDQVLLQRLERHHFALLLAILPATAAVVGLVALRQVPTGVEVGGVALVVVAILLRAPERVTEEEPGTTVV